MDADACFFLRLPSPPPPPFYNNNNNHLEMERRDDSSPLRDEQCVFNLGFIAYFFFAIGSIRSASDTMRSNWECSVFYTSPVRHRGFFYR